MQRLIPGKTKVSIELFRGVTIGDLIVAGVGLATLLLVLISNLPYKYYVAVGLVVLVVLLLVRLDEQPNYLYFLHILTFFGYKKKFSKIYSDQALTERYAKGTKEQAFNSFFGEDDEARAAEEKKRREKELKEERKIEDRLLRNRKTPEDVKQNILERRARAAEAALAGNSDYRTTGAAAAATSLGGSAESTAPAKPLTKKEQKAAEKKRKAERKEEDLQLKSKDVPEEQKDEIRERRRQESADAMQRMAIAKDASVKRHHMEDIIAFTGIKDGYIEYLNKSYYGAVIEIDPVEFRFFSEHRRVNSIENCFGRILRSLHAGYSANIVKLERPIMYDRYLQKEYDKLEQLSSSYENGVLTEEELKARVEIEYDRINELISYTEDRQIITEFFYLVLFESDKRQLENQIRDAEQQLRNGELSVHRLDDKELAVFLKYSNQIDFDEREIDNIRPEDYHLWAMPNQVDIKVRRVEINHIITHNFRVVNYPTVVDDAWLASVMSLPATKVVVKCKPMDRQKSIRNIDHSLQELRGQWSATGVDSRRLEIENHINTLQDLLTTLQNDSEVLLETNIYITAYDIVATRNNYKIPQPPASELATVNEMKKNVRRTWQENGFRLNNMEFDQVQAFIGAQINALDPVSSEGRGISTNTVAACYPWVFAYISDEGGIKLGENDGIPVFIDFFRRDSERVNSNMVIVGKSGSGKSYATKSLLANMAAENAKIFILDPENEYTELAGNLHGQIINVGNAQYGRLNPFHIITALDDDEAGDTGPAGSYATHLQFLEEFFKQIMPDCSKDAMEYLNTLVDHMYMEHNITAETDLSTLRPEDYPIFDDLYDEVLQEFQGTDNPFTRDLLRTLMNYIAKFSTGGRNANIWNGPSTITTDENFTVFNFQSMLANRNQTIANAQMLLVLKYIDNEIIKNRDYNTRYHADRKIVVVIDEAHVFIDAKFPIALDFMFQLAKRIRKYNGMQIVITQNIKDFVGSEELARKSTAIINACQYSFIFSLAPNDMQDLVTLYEKAGGINEIEQEQIVQAPRGQAFAIMSPTSRSTFRVETAQGITEMFEQREYVSRYFTGPTGDANWEDFVGISRAAHEKAIARGTAPAVIEEQSTYAGSGKVSFEVFDEDEYNAMISDETETDSDGIRFSFEELEDELPPEETYVPTQEIQTGNTETPAAGAVGEEQMAVFSMIADALGRMADAAERGENVMTPRRTSFRDVDPEDDLTEEDAAVSDEVAALLAEKEKEIERLQREKDEEIRRLKEELESETAQTETSGTEDDIFGTDTGEIEDVDALFAADNDPFAGLDDDDFGEEEDGDLSVEALMPDEELDDISAYFGEDVPEDGDGAFADDFNLDAEAFGSSSLDDIEDDFGTDDFGEDTFSFEEEDGLDVDSFSEDDVDRLLNSYNDEKEEKEEDDEDDDSEDEEEDDFDDFDDEEEDEDDEEDEDEDDDDFMSSFCSFAAHLQNMTMFEKMRANGQEVMPVTLDDLIKEAKAQLDRKRAS